MIWPTPLLSAEVAASRTLAISELTFETVTPALLPKKLVIADTSLSNVVVILPIMLAISDSTAETLELARLLTLVMPPKRLAERLLFKAEVKAATMLVAAESSLFKAEVTSPKMLLASELIAEISLLALGGKMLVTPCKMLVAAEMSLSKTEVISPTTLVAIDNSLLMAEVMPPTMLIAPEISLLTSEVIPSTMLVTPESSVLIAEVIPPISLPKAPVAFPITDVR